MIRSKTFSAVFATLPLFAAIILGSARNAAGIGLTVSGVESGIGKARCINQYIYSNMVVTGSVRIEGSSQIQDLRLNVTEISSGSVLYSSPTIKSEVKFVYSSHHDGYVKYCFYNVYSSAPSSDTQENKSNDTNISVTESKQTHVVMLLDAGTYSRLENHETPNNTLIEFEDKISALDTTSSSIEKEMIAASNYERQIFYLLSRLIPVFWTFSLLLLLFSIAIVAWQYYELRRYFRIKKLL